MIQDAPVVVKHYADAFFKTDLQDILQQLAVDELIIAGMMTQNGVMLTALANEANHYKVTVLTDVTTTVSQIASDCTTCVVNPGQSGRYK
ncbi:isochorismatase family protein [Neisseriaceae bacterium ESL0693]|nr:isochorismatase family protein [Neisseriaceae bacterium ESL0693]